MNKSTGHTDPSRAKCPEISSPVPGNPRVLLADDHAIVRDGLRLILEAAGMTVLSDAANGREALEQARPK